MSRQKDALSSRTLVNSGASSTALNDSRFGVAGDGAGDHRLKPALSGAASTTRAQDRHVCQVARILHSHGEAPSALRLRLRGDGRCSRRPGSPGRAHRSLDSTAVAVAR